MPYRIVFSCLTVEYFFSQFSKIPKMFYTQCLCSFQEAKKHTFFLNIFRLTLLVGFVMLDLYFLNVCFADLCLSFCTFSSGYCFVCSSSIYGFWLLLWYLQTLLIKVEHIRGHLWHRYSVAVNQVIVVTVQLSKWRLQNGRRLVCCRFYHLS
jgi:hypothetical protein